MPQGICSSSRCQQKQHEIRLEIFTRSLSTLVVILHSMSHVYDICYYRKLCVMFFHSISTRHATKSLLVTAITTNMYTLQWRHNECDGVSNHRRPGCLPNRWFRRRSKRTSKLSVAGFCEENSPVTGEFPAQRTSNAGNVSIWRRHHGHSNWWEVCLGDLHL